VRPPGIKGGRYERAGRRRLPEACLGRGGGGMRFYVSGGVGRKGKNLGPEKINSLTYPVGGGASVIVTRLILGLGRCARLKYVVGLGEKPSFARAGVVHQLLPGGARAGMPRARNSRVRGVLLHLGFFFLCFVIWDPELGSKPLPRRRKRSWVLGVLVDPRGRSFTTSVADQPERSAQRPRPALPEAWPGSRSRRSRGG